VEGLVTVAGTDWRGRSTFVTGHTGFKGGWLALWLHHLGAVVHGYALDPDSSPALFDAARIGSVMATDTRADLADRGRLHAALAEAAPSVVFHLAAQPLVRQSYADPIGTLQTNVIGTAHLLDAVRSVASVRAVVVITTDKVYENRESGRAFGEADMLGGHDLYSASKAAAEIVTAAYRSSFFSGPNAHHALVATARAGNVIGGGDWAADRLVPDCLKAFARGQAVHLRYPDAVRPWQHVLEPLSGYLRLAESLLAADGLEFARPWNFGPDASGDATVRRVAERLAALWGNGAQVQCDPSTDHPHEAGLLHLDSTAARSHLAWAPRWPLDEALENTVEWYRYFTRHDDMHAVTIEQIERYQGSTAG
jgi:CDP-glucose 4,6-dehydratase